MVLVASTGPHRSSAQLFPFTSLRHIFDNLKIRGRGNNVARIHSEYDYHPVRTVVASTTIPQNLPTSTSPAPTIFLADPETQYRKLEQERSRLYGHNPIPATSKISEQKSSSVFKRSPPLPPVPSSFLQPPPKDVFLRVDLSEVKKLAGEKTKPKQPDNTVASSVDVPKNHKASPAKKAPNHRIKDVPPSPKKKAPSINTPRKRPEKHPMAKLEATATMDVASQNRLAPRPTLAAAPSETVSESEETANYLDVPEGGEDRVEFQMHGLQGPKSYKFGFDTGKG